MNGLFIGASRQLGEFESGVTAHYMGTVPAVVFGGFMTLLVVGITSAKATILHNLHINVDEETKTTN